MLRLDPTHHKLKYAITSKLITMVSDGGGNYNFRLLVAASLVIRRVFSLACCNIILTVTRANYKVYLFAAYVILTSRGSEE